MVELSIFLFGKPAWMVDLEGKEIDKEFCKRLKELGSYIDEILNETSDQIGKLLENGWEAQGGLYTVELHKDISFEDAEKELQSLGLDELKDGLIEWEE